MDKLRSVGDAIQPSASCKSPFSPPFMKLCYLTGNLYPISYLMLLLLPLEAKSKKTIMVSLFVLPFNLLAIFSIGRTKSVAIWQGIWACIEFPGFQPPVIQNRAKKKKKKQNKKQKKGLETVGNK